MNTSEAYVLVNVHAGNAFSAADAILRLPGVRSACVITGPYDIITRIEAERAEIIIDIVVNKIQTMANVTRTITCIVVASEAQGLESADDVGDEALA
jgi:hypothetical protein